MEKGPIGLYHDHGDLQQLQTLAQGVRQGRGRAVEGVAGLRIQEHGGAELFQGIDHVPDQSRVGNELLGGDAAQMPHEIVLAHETVGGAHDVEGPGVEDGGGDLQIQKAGVVHEEKGRLVFAQAFHALLLPLKVNLFELPGAERLEERAEKQAGLQRLLPGRLGQADDLIVGKGGVLDLHGVAPLLCLPTSILQIPPAVKTDTKKVPGHTSLVYGYIRPCFSMWNYGTIHNRGE